MGNENFTIGSKVNEIEKDAHYEESLIARIADCHAVVERLDNDPAWKVIYSDLNDLKNRIDSSWQEIDDDKRLERARVMKFAVQHLIDIKKSYHDELLAAQEALQKLQNKETEVAKDYDGE